MEKILPKAKFMAAVTESSVCTRSVLSGDLHFNKIMVRNLCWNYHLTNYRHNRFTSKLLTISAIITNYWMSPDDKIPA